MYDVKNMFRASYRRGAPSACTVSSTTDSSIATAHFTQNGGVKKTFRTPNHRGNKCTIAEHAFTLVEVMMASVVMLFAIATSLTTLQYGLRSVDTARNTTIASQILQSSVELLRLQNWTQITALQTAQATATTPTNVNL